MAQTPQRTAVFTIVAKNYLAYARTLMASVKAVHQTWERFVLLADRADGFFDTSAESFRTVEIRALPIPDRNAFFFRYNLLELSTATKPWFFRFLFQQGYDRVLYLDPDVALYAPLDEAVRAWDAGAMAVFTPHLTGRVRGDLRPSEKHVLQSGTYNLGFAALARGSDLEALLDFWCEKSVREFVVDIASGLFTDQKWMDLTPGMFRDVHILRHEGYNVAYWNLAHRTVSRNGDGDYSVNGVPLVFFHFSGVDAREPDSLSRHQNRYRLSEVGAVAPLVREYCQRLLENGWNESRDWPCAYGHLNDGTPIPDSLRRLLDMCPEFAAIGGSDPFALTGAQIDGPSDAATPPISWRMRAIHAARIDLQFAFPDPLGRDRAEFARWFAGHAGSTTGVETDLPPQPVLPAAPAPPPAGPAGPGWRGAGPWPSRAALRWDLLVIGARKAVRAARAGRLPFSFRYWVQMLELLRHEEDQRHAQETRRAALFPSTASQMTTRDHDRGGIAIVGYAGDATGVGQSASAAATACAAAGIPAEFVDARAPAPPLAGYPVTVMFVNADQTPIACRMLGESFLKNRYTIGVWAWELDELPEESVASFDHLDEVWAPSQFVMRTVAAKSPVPVVHMPYPVSVARSAAASRTAFGLPEDRFLFLISYDMLSVQERKNPVGAIDAFGRAFHQDDRVGLVVKINHGSHAPDEVARVGDRLKRHPGAVIVDRTLSHQQAIDLHAVCDAYVSLHRSEGFGLNIAEAMLLGKPVVATAWSGNTDFMDAENSCPVTYDLIRLDQDFGPYRQGNHWADPDLDHAASYMRRLVDDDAFRRQIGARAMATIAAGYSYEVIGQRYRQRLAVIDRHR